MSNLKELRNRIDSVQATRKITRAMQMVAVAKLKKAREEVDKILPYNQKMQHLVADAAKAAEEICHDNLLLTGGKGNNQLLILASSERGLCGSFNYSIFKKMMSDIEEYKKNGAKIQIICVGKKGYEITKKRYGSDIVDFISLAEHRTITIDLAKMITKKIVERIEKQQSDSCSLYYAKFKSVMTQIPTVQNHVPVDIDESQQKQMYYYFEPDEKNIIEKLLPYAMSIRIFCALLENNASELGARMSAMDSATRNAAELIDNLTLKYNRARQAMITKELIEIISGAEALNA